MFTHMIKPTIFKDPMDGMWICEVLSYCRYELGMPKPTTEEDCHYFAYGEGSTAKEAYQNWLEEKAERLLATKGEDNV